MIFKTQCPNCGGTNITKEEIRTEVKDESVGRLVMSSWLQPGGIMRNRKHYKQETRCTCKDCGFVFKARSKYEIGMAIFGVIIFVCLIILAIFGPKAV